MFRLPVAGVAMARFATHALRMKREGRLSRQSWVRMTGEAADVLTSLQRHCVDPGQSRFDLLRVIIGQDIEGSRMGVITFPNGRAGSPALDIGHGCGPSGL